MTILMMNKNPKAERNGPVMLIASFAVAGSKSAKSKCGTTSYGTGGTEVVSARDALREVLPVVIPTNKQFFDFEKLACLLFLLINISWYNEILSAHCEIVSIERNHGDN